MSHPEHTYYVYLIASRSRVLYCGVTNNLRRRLEQHREGSIDGFTADYNCMRLVWFERFQDVNSAIAREKQIKRWRREKKIALIQQANPTWVAIFMSPGPSQQTENNTSLRPRMCPVVDLRNLPNSELGITLCRR
jgi:putative endonuclease